MKNPPELAQLADRLRREHAPAARPTLAEAVAWFVIAQIVEQKAAALLTAAARSEQAS